MRWKLGLHRRVVIGLEESESPCGRERERERLGNGGSGAVMMSGNQGDFFVRHFGTLDMLSSFL